MRLLEKMLERQNKQRAKKQCRRCKWIFVKCLDCWENRLFREKTETDDEVEKSEPAGMTFSEAVQAMKEGKKVRREIWAKWCWIIAMSYSKNIQICFDDRAGTLEYYDWLPSLREVEATDWQVVK